MKIEITSDFRATRTARTNAGSRPAKSSRICPATWPTSMSARGWRRRAASPEPASQALQKASRLSLFLGRGKRCVRLPLRCGEGVGKVGIPFAGQPDLLPKCLRLNDGAT